MSILPVCIPSYKNRDYTKILFSNLYTLDDVYIFVYDFDYKESGYDKIDFPQNVKIVQINIEKDFKKYNVNRTDLSTKRCFIFDYMTELGIDRYIAIDDDIGNNTYIKNEKNDVTQVDLRTFIIEMYKRIENYENQGKQWCIVSPILFSETNNRSIFKKYHKDMLIHRFAWEGSVMFMNRKLCYENNIKHIPLAASDISLNILCLKNNLFPLVASYFYIKCYPMDINHSTLSEKSRKELMYTFKYFPNDTYLDFQYGIGKNYLHIGPKDYIDIANHSCSMNRKYKELYELALNDDIDNFIEKLYEILITSYNKRTNKSNLNIEW